MIDDSQLTSASTTNKKTCTDIPMLMCHCSEGQVFASHFKGKVLRKAMQTLNISVISEQPFSDEDIELGLKTYLQLSFCPIMFTERFLFQMKLSKERSLGTILQALMNNLQNNPDPASLYRLKQFFVKFDEQFNLRLGSSLSSISSTSTMEDFLSQDVPFFLRDSRNASDMTGVNGCI